MFDEERQKFLNWSYQQLVCWAMVDSEHLIIEFESGKLMLYTNLPFFIDECLIYYTQSAYNLINYSQTDQDFYNYQFTKDTVLTQKMYSTCKRNLRLK